MTRARLRAVLLLIAVLLGAAALALAGRTARTPAPLAERPATERPVLLLLTSLPLVFGEQFSLEGGGSLALAALERRYRVVPISVVSPGELAKGGLLLMAQPHAQPPENLVALDRWVRDGGRLLLLADPLLEWPSERPLGDALRPPAMFMDTGLLKHWGLRLDAPDHRGPAVREIAGLQVKTLSPGTLHGSCDVAAEGMVARCGLGKGRTIVVADADLLGVQHVEGAKDNLDAINSLLAELERR